jgi:hypothetical protein
MAKPLWNDWLIGCLTGGSSASDLKIVRKARIFIGEKTMTAKHVVLRAVYVMGLMAGFSLTWVVNVRGHAIHPPIGTPLPDPHRCFRHSSFGLSTTQQQVRERLFLKDMKFPQ